MTVIGVVLMGLSGALWVTLPIIPFLPIDVGMKAAVFQLPSSVRDERHQDLMRRVASGRHYFDMLSFMQQLGVL